MEKQPIPLATALAFSFIILLASGIIKKARTQPLCLPQFELANQACSLILPPPRPSNESSSHNGHHRRRQRRHHENDLQDSPCCRRINGIDPACICWLMNRRLPVFVSKPNHTIVLRPNDDCEVTFHCPSLGGRTPH
ncbi:hypothetical protein HHK36_024642 [Tetracentron sinense]|uniref:Uncharacterized protein n=1 Tax=Tetracentron sinense TaxID=13715 RepID=A0A834YNG1_TETSI|nr:hypothetical protein HHK36_024642 [Tetracentron sinense]